MKWGGGGGGGGDERFVVWDQDHSYQFREEGKSCYGGAWEGRDFIPMHA